VSPACIESRFRRPAGHPSHDLADTVWVDLESDDTYVIDEDEVGPGPVPGVRYVRALAGVGQLSL
jgi:hypothetical protein